MKTNLLKSMSEGGINAVMFLASAVWTFVKWLFGNKTHWSGLIPTALLAIAAFWALQKTSDQLEVLQEQITYVREPVMVVYSHPVDNWHDLVLHVANVGNDTVKNVRVRIGLFLVTDSQIYSYGQFFNPSAYLDITGERTPRQRLWPLLTLGPNEEVDIWNRVQYCLLQPFIGFVPEEDDPEAEVRAVARLFEGEYVLFVECSYRRRTDFVQYADTTYLHYSLYPLPIHEDLRLEIGGHRVIARLKKYLAEGPQLSINIKEDEYLIFKHGFGRSASTVSRVPRKTQGTE
jgi:hypothetical protein